MAIPSSDYHKNLLTALAASAIDPLQVFLAQEQRDVIKHNPDHATSLLKTFLWMPSAKVFTMVYKAASLYSASSLCFWHHPLILTPSLLMVQPLWFQ